MSLNKSDIEAFQQIVAKAKGCGMLGALRDQVDVAASSSPTSDFSLVTEQPAAMNDASKRRAVTDLADLQQPASAGYIYTGYFRVPWNLCGCNLVVN